MRPFLTAVAIVLTFVGYVPYLRSIATGATRPHVFSWIIWGMTTFIVFFAQLEGGGGLGAWPIGVSGTIAISVAILTWVRRGDSTITRTDWVFFCMALGSLPLWYFTSSPLWSVVILTTTDVLGFGPTLRKAFTHPFEENMTFWGLFIVRNSVAIGALEHLSVTTMLFPLGTGFACLVLVLVVAYRRARLTAARQSRQ